MTSDNPRSLRRSPTTVVIATFSGAVVIGAAFFTPWISAQAEENTDDNAAPEAPWGPEQAERVEFELTDEQRETLACGRTNFLDKTGEGYKPSPTEAVQADLHWAVAALERGDPENDPIPRAVRIALLEGAVKTLETTERSESFTGEVEVAGIGSVYIEPSYDETLYVVTQYNIVPQWPERCAELEAE